MSKFDHRSLYDLPKIQPIESFKQLVLGQVTIVEQIFVRIAHTLNKQLEENQNFRNVVVTGVVLVLVISFLKYIGNKKHSFYAKSNVTHTEINKTTHSLKQQTDAFRKYVLNFISAGQNQTVNQGDNKQVVGQQLDNSFKNLGKILDIYGSCIKTNNKFNEYFLDEFLNIFVQLKQLKKSKGIRSSSKRKDIPENKMNGSIEKQIVIQKPSGINNVPQKKRPTARVPVPRKEKKQQPLVVETFIDQTSQNPISKSTTQPAQQSLLIQSDNYNDAFVAQTQQQTFPQTQQSKHKQQQSINNNLLQSPIQNAQDQIQQQSIIDDPILSVPIVQTTVKHSLPTLPIKPKRDIPPMAGGRRPPPPPRR